jgi:hypothetical protein
VESAAKVEEQYPWEKKHNRMVSLTIQEEFEYMLTVILRMQFWRGFANGYSPRRDLMDRTSVKIDASRETWADVHETTFHPEADHGDYYPLVATHDHCQHKYLIHTEGNSYSGWVLKCQGTYSKQASILLTTSPLRSLLSLSSRSKYLFSCRSITVAHPLEWTQHFHPALNSNPESPNQNYIELLGPLFSGLEESAKELQEAESLKWYQQTQLKDIGKKTPRMVADNAMRTLRDRECKGAVKGPECEAVCMFVCDWRLLIAFFLL